nr:flavin-dependent halogenase [uncultured bacterium]
MQGQIKNILIVGGGTAGWMTACMLSKRLDDINITLIESSDIPTVGVGEATIIQMNFFLREMGLTENDWMPSCNATYKEGIYFENFYRNGEHYWNPFQPLGVESTDYWIHKYYKENLSPDSYFDYCFSNTVRNSNNRIDLETKINQDQIRNVFYTYHLDASLFAQHLKAKVALPGGVKHIVDNVTEVNLAEDGSVSGIETGANGTLNADLYVDCSGFRSLLLGDKLGEPFIDYNDRLPNDRAIAIRMPYEDRDKEMHPYTSATALEAGWVWNIPLWHRIGTGYVYSSQYKSEDDAEFEFRQHLGEDRVKDLQAHHIKMRIGKYECPWKKNVVGIGLAGGFVEPLESTGIELAQLGAGFLSWYLKKSPTNRAISQKLYNAKMQSVYDEVSDYIQLHYVLTDREDTEYWRDQKYTEADIRTSVLHKLTRRDASFSFDETGDVFSNTAWNALLIGMRQIPVHDIFSRSRPIDPNKFAMANKAMEDNYRKAKQQAVAVSGGVKNPTHHEYLAKTVYKGIEIE